MLRFYTAGESHGKCLIGYLEGLPSGLFVDCDFINQQLYRRQLGYGRGGRMAIESDRIDILSGIRHGKTLGSPISFLIPNKDWSQWQIPMSAAAVAEGSELRTVTRPRPGHADLSGALKFNTHDIRDILERASARESATRVAGGALCRMLLSHFDIRIGSHVIAIGQEQVSESYRALPLDDILALDYESPIRCADVQAAKRMIDLIDKTQKAGDTLGGVVEVIADRIPPGLGTHIQWDRRLDGLIAQAFMSIPSAKAVEIGSGIKGAQLTGSMVHDPIFYQAAEKRFFHETNRAGGIEGGISNGEELRAYIYFKPIPTLSRPLASVDVLSKMPFEAAVERGDTCVIPAAGVIAEAMLGIVLATVFLEKLGGDSLKEVESKYQAYLKQLEEY
jgi:chorismate synthase